MSHDIIVTAALEATNVPEVTFITILGTYLRPNVKAALLKHSIIVNYVQMRKIIV